MHYALTRGLDMKIPRIVKYTLINFVKIAVFITVGMCMAISIGFLIEFLKLNDINPFWAIVPIIICVMTGFSFMIARFDVQQDEIRDRRVQDILSRD